MLSERPDFELGKAGLWAFATVPATFLFVFRGWFFLVVVFAPMIWLMYGNGWFVLGFLALAAGAAAAQQVYDVRAGDLRRWLSGWINPTRRRACRRPPRWPRGPRGPRETPLTKRAGRH